MSFCVECGADHHIADREAEKIADREVTLARISAERDIKIAQIGASTAAVLAETENTVSTAHAEGIAEGMETVLEAAGGGQAEEPADAEPVIVETPAEEPAEEPGADMEPPIVETPGPSSRSTGGGWWGGYN